MFYCFRTGRRCSSKAECCARHEMDGWRRCGPLAQKGSGRQHAAFETRGHQSFEPFLWLTMVRLPTVAA
jgi:hypothetical protein